MHPDQVPIDTGVARGLVAEQFPEWADLDIEPVQSGGTVNAIFRLGTSMSLRLPLTASGVTSLEHETRWLPVLQPQLPIQVPTPLAMGRPAGTYPFPWSVHTWIEGEPASKEPPPDLSRAARDLGGFASALQAIDPTKGPANMHRAMPLITADGPTRAAIAAAGAAIDASAVTSAWERALEAPAWELDPVWVHGDLWSSNLLVREGRLVGVIDFGNVGTGDPAIDTLPAWSLFDDESRIAFRASSGADDATWERGKGWAISMAALAIPYYLDSNPAIVSNAGRMLAAVLGD
jgi:aminoglycoside phosphotransferase (APT) family kinase protein